MALTKEAASISDAATAKIFLDKVKHLCDKLLEMDDATVDGRTEGGKFPFVFGLNVIGRRVGVKVESDVVDVEIEQLELLEGVIEERAIIGLEMKFGAAFEDSTILVEKINVGETALGVLISRPGIAKIYIEAIDLVGGKNFIDVGDVESGESDVGQRKVAALTSGGVKDGGFRLEPDEIDLGKLRGDRRNEIALADPELHEKIIRN